MTDGGSYRSSYSALADDEDFQNLSPLAQAVFGTLKLKLGQYGIDVFYVTLLREFHRKASEADLLAAVAELEEMKPSGSHGWIRRERNVYWIRNGLKFEPSLSLENANHRKGALRHALSLARIQIVDSFISYYELGDAELARSGRPKKAHSDKSHPDGISAGQEITETEKKETETTTPPSPPPPAIEKIVVAGNGGVEATLIAVATALENREDRKALRRIVEAAPDSDSWLGAMASALNRETGFPPLTPALLGQALREFVGQGGVKKKGMSYTYFMRFLENVTASKRGKPPPTGAFRRAGRAEEYDPLPPTKSDQEIRWAR